MISFLIYISVIITIGLLSNLNRYFIFLRSNDYLFKNNKVRIVKYSNKMHAFTLMLDLSKTVFVSEKLKNSISDNELLAIKHHEFGHIYYSHGLARALILSLLISCPFICYVNSIHFMFSNITGIIIFISYVILARQMEFAADRYVKKRYMIAVFFESLAKRKSKGVGLLHPSLKNRMRKSLKWEIT